MNERLSAFLDGEATGDEIDSVLNALLSDEAMRATWSRQHWIRTTLRASDTETPLALDPDFSDRVMQAIATEDQPEPIMVATSPRVASRGRRRLSRRSWRGLTGMGMAAAVVGVVVVSSNSFTPGATRGQDRTVATRDRIEPSDARTEPRAIETTSQQNPVADTRAGGFASGAWNEDLVDFATIRAADSAGASARTVSARSVDSEADRWSSVNDPAVRDELNGYLVDHNGMARGYGMSSTTPAYVRVATYGQGAAQ